MDSRIASLASCAKHPKWHNWHIGTVPGPVWDRLKNELPDDPNALVFPRQRGGLLPIEEYRRAFDKACAQVGIEGLVPHGLPHTTASLAISAGANVKVVQRILGHATAAMTLDLYGHPLDDDLSGVAEALGKAIDSTAVSRAEFRQAGAYIRS